MKYISNKFLLLLLIFTALLNLNINSADLDYVDSVNIRKAFFLNESNWNKYAVIEVHKFDQDNRIGLICKISNENYQLRFFTIQKDPKIFYSLGKIDYLLSKDKELLKAMFFYQNNEKFIFIL